MTRRAEQAPPDQDRSNWPMRIGLAVIGLLLLVVLYLALAAFIPRWWALRVGNLAEQSFARGISWGLFFGVISTLVPLLLLFFAAIRWRGTAGKYLGTTALVLAAIFAAPNLMTLAIVQGGSNAAHAGERIFDTEAPGFRGASLMGAIFAALVFIAVLFFYVKYRRRGKELRDEREAKEKREADVNREAKEKRGAEVNREANRELETREKRNSEENLDAEVDREANRELEAKEKRG